eukprot:gene4605-4859_t
MAMVADERGQLDGQDALDCQVTLPQWAVDAVPVVEPKATSGEERPNGDSNWEAIADELVARILADLKQTNPTTAKHFIMLQTLLEPCGVNTLLPLQA